MKGNYNIYPMYGEQLKRMFKKSDLGKLSKQKILTMLYKDQPSMISTIDCPISGEELYWERNSRVVIFPESKEVLEKVERTKFNISKMLNVNMPHDCFILAMPKGFTIDGYEATGCMVTFIRHSERAEKVLHPFLRYIDFPEIVSPDKQDFDDGTSLMLTYYNPIPTPGAKHRVVARTSIPAAVIPDLLRAKDGEEYSNLINKHVANGLHFQHDLNDLDHSYQFQLAKIVIKLALYASSQEGALKEGYPGIRPKRLEPKGIKYHDQKFGMTHKESDERGMHYRSFHFRQLMDDRYYKGEHAHKPKGSRIVFVKEAMINSVEVEPETLT